MPRLNFPQIFSDRLTQVEDYVNTHLGLVKNVRNFYQQETEIDPVDVIEMPENSVLYIIKGYFRNDDNTVISTVDVVTPQGEFVLESKLIAAIGGTDVYNDVTELDNSLVTKFENPVNIEYFNIVGIVFEYNPFPVPVVPPLSVLRQFIYGMSTMAGGAVDVFTVLLNSIGTVQPTELIVDEGKVITLVSHALVTINIPVTQANVTAGVFSFSLANLVIDTSTLGFSSQGFCNVQIPSGILKNDSPIYSNLINDSLLCRFSDNDFNSGANPIPAADGNQFNATWANVVNLQKLNFIANNEPQVTLYNGDGSFNQTFLFADITITTILLVTWASPLAAGNYRVVINNGVVFDGSVGNLDVNQVFAHDFVVV